MDQEAIRFPSKTRPLWWRQRGITRFVAGVFEGGGAKGLLYRGALEAMVEDVERAYWFTAVAGASAGAITATLIAAALEPEQAADEAEKAVGTTTGTSGGCGGSPAHWRKDGSLNTNTG